MININCTSNCIHQKDGKCAMATPQTSGHFDGKCAYFSPREDKTKK